MNVERDVVRALLKCSSPDGRVWTYVSEIAIVPTMDIMGHVERQLIRAREHGVNGRIDVRMSRDNVTGAISSDYEPVGPPRSRPEPGGGEGEG